MPDLKSHRMHLSPAERGWLPWFGRSGKLAMGWSCWLNRGRYAGVEQIFEGIAETRVRLLQQWVAAHWEHLADTVASFGEEAIRADGASLESKRAQLPDIAELFVVDTNGCVMASTRTAQVGTRVDARALAAGLRAPFLHGPYLDPATLAMGPTTSRFHDAVTLMFYQPLQAGGQTLGCLCARVPND